MIQFSDFEKIDIRVGKIVAVEHLENARYSTHKLTIDFGSELGTKKSCARVVSYSDEQLLGKLIIALINVPPRQIGQNMSEVLTLGIPDGKGECVLLGPDSDVPLGGKLF